MALPSAFQERLRQMEETRNQRLSLLQAERDLQSQRSLQLSARLSNLRRLEQRCLVLDQKNAALSFQILDKKSEIDVVNAEYQTITQQIRNMKRETSELEEVEKKRQRFYDEKTLEMKEFEDELRRSVSTSTLEVKKLRKDVDDLKSKLDGLKFQDGYMSNSEIAAAEARKGELSAQKMKLDQIVASNYQLRALLQKQLQHILRSREVLQIRSNEEEVQNSNVKG